MWNPTLPESQASKAKDKYRVTNWSEYDRALVRRGDITRHSAPNQVKNTLNCVYQLRNLEPLPQSQMRWVFQFFAGIHVLLIDSFREVILNCNEYHHQLLNLLGERYIRLYANSG